MRLSNGEQNKFFEKMVKTINYKHVNRGIGENNDETNIGLRVLFWGVGVGGLVKLG